MCLDERPISWSAEPRTVLFGRGANIHGHEKLFGMSIEPEKEVVLTVVYADQVDTVLNEIARAAEINDTGGGIAFVVPVERVVGVAHFMRGRPEKEKD